MESSRYDLAYCTSDAGEHVFLSVTEGFEHGPGIHRDGLTAPCMLDPHGIVSIRRHKRFKGMRLPRGMPPPGDMTDNPYVQRAGTWTVYHHLKNFADTLGEQGWRIVAAQSNGDLTMNPWHVAFVGSSPLNRTGAPFFCGLDIAEDNLREPVEGRMYRGVVKWNDDGAKRRDRRYEFLDFRIDATRNVILAAEPKKTNDSNGNAAASSDDEDITPFVEFALAGKPIIEQRRELSLAHAADRFQDVRHVLNIPEVMADKGADRGKVILGEYQLFHDINERRAALFVPIVVDLNVAGKYKIDPSTLAAQLPTYREVDEFPTRRGEFRRYRDSLDCIEIFLQHAVYPFGTLGVRADEKKREQIISLCCGGLSGRLGNTLEGVTRMMYNFLHCDDAMVLDEGLDVCLIVNRVIDDVMLSNETLLRKVITFTLAGIANDQKKSEGERQPAYETGGMHSYPLNRAMIEEVNADFRGRFVGTTDDYHDVFRVTPGRSQVRSMLIFARKSRLLSDAHGDD